MKNKTRPKTFKRSFKIQYVHLAGLATSLSNKPEVSVLVCVRV